ncbi:tetratricopeptide repeat protein [Streptomyces griseoviridis]|uniref:Tetratricopeptide repeat protein n=1 Tax=Streptomyces griseoviridis TaxID=45398 RepID=A0A918GR69_STRGD|nr:tetratricopeptide repeat protein [Streptomyces niveoruber]GGS55078.1 hypothetical protein GCM10010238_50630 [Streptomyces niveoruber]
MARLSRDKKRDHQRAGRPAAPAAPIDVRVPGAGGGTIGGVPVAAVPGEEIQQTVLNRLQGIARATGRPVFATVDDERIGYVVPLRVDPDGSSHLTGEPAARTAPDPAGDPARVPPAEPPRPAPAAPGTPAGDPSPAFRPPSPPQDRPGVFGPAPGTVRPPTGEFGPPPRMAPAPAPEDAPRPLFDPETEAGLRADTQPAPARGFDAVAEAVLGDGPITAPGDSTVPALLAGPTARVNEAVREGRTEDAARLAERTVAEATGTLGADHPEVLRLRELSAYIAYLSGDPERALRTALDVARAHHRAGDAETAYGTVRSAATAWRAVREPARGLELGHELIDLWTALAAEEGPAADDMAGLESVRARMGRLTERARALEA